MTLLDRKWLLVRLAISFRTALGRTEAARQVSYDPIDTPAISNTGARRITPHAMSFAPAFGEDRQK